MLYVDCRITFRKKFIDDNSGLCIASFRREIQRTTHTLGWNKRFGFQQLSFPIKKTLWPLAGIAKRLSYLFCDVAAGRRPIGFFSFQKFHIPLSDIKINASSSFYLSSPLIGSNIHPKTFIAFAPAYFIVHVLLS